MQPEKLRVAFPTPEYVTEHHFDGGLANYVDRVTKLLAQLGHDVHVVTLSLKDEDEFENDGVTVHRVTLKHGWLLLNRITRYSFPTTLHWLNFSAQVGRKLRQLHRQNPFHLIQYPNYSSCGLFSIPFVRAAHVVRASSYQPALNDAAGLKRNLDHALAGSLERLQYKFTKNVFAPSNAVQKLLTKHAVASEVPVIRTPFYVETRDWDYRVYDQFLNGKDYVLYFGRFQLHKGFHTIAQALPVFLKEHPNAYAALVGRDMETSLASSMAEFARAQCGDSAARLVLLGNLPHSQLYPIIAGARVVALPSLFDNSPNTCLEAMGLGKAVIGTNNTSFDELITDGVNGFLVPPDDPEILARKLIDAWVDPNLEEISASAKQQMLEFAPNKTIPALLNYYSGVIGKDTNDSHKDTQQAQDQLD
jgi:glycosyltransferase involved in cell wall biosynthesis